MDTDRHAGKVVIITGAAGGIGAATARRLFGEGAGLMLSDISNRRLLALADELDDESRVTVMKTDAAESDQLEQLVASTVNRFGRLDTLVNNVGVITVGTVEETSPVDWHRVMDIDLHSVYYTSRAALPHLVRTKGSIVNTASISGMYGNYGLLAYCTAKGAVINMTRTMAIDHARQGVRVNCVSPGPVNSHPGGMMDFPSMKEVYDANIPLGRVELPEEIAPIISFLASTDASFVTGHNLVADGGLTAHSGEPNFNALYGDQLRATPGVVTAS